MRWLERALIFMTLGVLSCSLAVLIDFTVFKYGDPAKTPSGLLLSHLDLGSLKIGARLLLWMGADALFYFAVVVVALAAFKKFRRALFK